MTPEQIAALVNLGSAGAVIVVVVFFLRSNEKRDEQQARANEKRDAEWRDFFTALNANNKDDVCQLAETMERMVASLDRHDAQAKEIKVVVDRIDKQVTKPLPRNRPN